MAAPPSIVVDNASTTHSLDNPVGFNHRTMNKRRHRRQQSSLAQMDMVARRRQKRQRVIAEIVSSEEAYVGHLSTALAVFRDPLQSMAEDGLFPQALVQRLFSNLGPSEPVHNGDTTLTHGR